MEGRSSDDVKNRFNSNLRKMKSVKTSKRKVTIVDSNKGPQDLMGRFEITMSYEDYVRRKAS